MGGFHIAAGRGHNETLSMLMKANTSIESQNQRGCTALHEAVSHAQHETVKFLLKMHAFVDARVRSNAGWTGLHWAARNGCKECVELLLNSGSFTLLEDSCNRTPEDLACKFGHTDIA